MRHRFVLFMILVVAIAVRYWYIQYAGHIVFEPDSQGYYTAGEFFTSDFLHNFFNFYRTPGYQMFSSLLLSLSGYGHPSFQSAKFLEAMPLLTFVQSVAGVVGLAVLYFMLLRSGISQSLSLFFTFFTSLNIYQFIWERAFLTEALSIFLLHVLMALFFSMMRKWSKGKLVWFVIIAVYEFFLKPSFIGLPFVTLPFLFLLHKRNQNAVWIGIALVVYSTVPVGYSMMNKILYGYSGVSVNSDIAHFGRILQHKLPITGGESVPFFYHNITEYRSVGGDTSIPWIFMYAYDNRMYEHVDRLNELQRFTFLVIKKNPIAYLHSMVRDIPRAFADYDVDIVWYVKPGGTDVGSGFFGALTWIIRSIQKSTIVFLLYYPLTIIVYLRKRTFFRLFLLIIGTVELYQLVMGIVFGGAWEFARHIIPTQTYLFLFCFIWWGMIGRMCYQLVSGIVRARS